MQKETLIYTAWGGKIVLPPEDLKLASAFATLAGEWEPQLTRFLLRNVKHGDVVVDVGANVGYFSVLLGQLIGSQGLMYVYEANPSAYNYVMKNLLINDLHDRAHVSNVAVYSEETALSFFVYEHCPTHSSIYSPSEEYHRLLDRENKIKEIKIDAVVLDKKLSSRDNIDLLKIDIEGGEYQAFIGMQRLLTENIVKTVVFELNKPMLQNDWEPFITLLTNLSNKGKQFFLISDNGEIVPTSITELTIPIMNGTIFCHANVVMK